MEETALKQLIRNVILTTFAKEGVFYLPVAVSARHVHLSRHDFEALFGKGASMTRYRELSQPGQFACGETVELTGPRGSIKNVRVLGPERNESQVEISVSDSFSLGIKPFVRMSGEIAGTPGCILTGPAGRVELGKGVIAAARHVHMSPDQAAAYGVREGDAVSLKTPAPRESVMGGVVVRIGTGFDLEVHLDTDEANGGGILCGTILPAVIGAGHSGEPACGGGKDSPLNGLDLVTERDINRAFLHGEKTIYCTVNGFISPAAADRAKEKGITICRLQK